MSQPKYPPRSAVALVIDHLKELSEVVLLRAAALAEVSLKQLPCDALEFGELEARDLVEAVYLDGVQDAMTYLSHLLDERGKA